MRWLFALIFCLLLAGCGPSASREELGTVSERMPEVPGTKEPFKMPELERQAPAPPKVRAGAPAEGSAEPNSVAPDQEKPRAEGELPETGETP